jgi:hypothetical protein
MSDVSLKGEYELSYVELEAVSGGFRGETVSNNPPPSPKSETVSNGGSIPSMGCPASESGPEGYGHCQV